MPTVGPRPEISFGADGLFSGSSGINRLVGTSEDSELLTILVGGTNRMAGPLEVMEQESRFLAAFSRAPCAALTVVVAPSRLELGESKTGLVPLEAPSDPATAETAACPDPAR